MSSISDVNGFIDFIKESFIESRYDKNGHNKDTADDNKSFLKLYSPSPLPLSPSLPLSPTLSPSTPFLRIGSDIKITSPTGKVCM